MCALTAYEQFLMWLGLLGMAVLLALLVVYGAEWIGLVWRDTTKGEMKND